MDVGRASDPEIRHHRATCIAFEQDVVGLHVTMDDPARVRMRERPRDFLHHAHRFAGRERTGAPYTLAERLSIHEAHHKEHDRGVLLDRVNRDDMRM